MFVWQLLFFHIYSSIWSVRVCVTIRVTGQHTHVPFWYGSWTNISSLYECVRSVYMYEICLCLSACVLLRVLLVHMDATHCTWCMNMYDTHMGLYIWVCTYRCSNEIWEINWHFVGILPARTAVFIPALNTVPRGIFSLFLFIFFQYQQNHNVHP